MTKPLMMFVNSMGDLFHEEVPIDFIHQAQKVGYKTPLSYDTRLPKSLLRAHRSLLGYSP
jgi:protein gp37